MSFFKGKYRIESSRLESWDYSWPGWYYVTINTRRHQTFFGEISDNTMHLSTIGEIVKEEWLKTAKIRRYLEFDEWQIMPNHLHAILIINQQSGVERTGRARMTGRVVSTTLKPDSLGSILGQFKSACTKRIHNAGYKTFGWQTRFYDHIIRNEEDLSRIRQYIRNNVLKWELDEYHPANLRL